MSGLETDSPAAGQAHVGEPEVRVAQDARRCASGLVCGSAGCGPGPAAAVPVPPAAAAALHAATHPGPAARQPCFRGGRCACFGNAKFLRIAKPGPTDSCPSSLFLCPIRHTLMPKIMTAVMHTEAWDTSQCLCPKKHCVYQSRCHLGLQ